MQSIRTGLLAIRRRSHFEEGQGLKLRDRPVGLNKALQEWQRSQELRAFLAAVDEAARRRLGTIPETSPVSEWLGWARRLADRADPLEEFIDRLANGGGAA